MGLSDKLLTFTDVMNEQISAGVTISVETFYQPEYSNPLNGEFMFAYRIEIENNNQFPIKLLRRRWHIIDADGSRREMEGKGVVGMQPVIQPGENYRYISGVNLRTEIGKMYGAFCMQNQQNKHRFDAAIPEFVMVVPLKMS